MAQTTYATMLVWTVLTFLDQMKEEHLALLDPLASPQVKIPVAVAQQPPRVITLFYAGERERERGPLGYRMRRVQLPTIKVARERERERERVR